jgi:hypothetical protein
MLRTILVVLLLAVVGWVFWRVCHHQPGSPIAYRSGR